MSLEAARLRLERMKEVTMILNGLDFDEERDVERVEDLQREQGDLREELAPWMPQLIQSSDSKQIIKDCIEMEQGLQLKINKYHEWAQNNIHKLQLGSRSKRIYSGGFYQTEGYFVDRKK